MTFALYASCRRFEGICEVYFRHNVFAHALRRTLISTAGVVALGYSLRRYLRRASAVERRSNRRADRIRRAADRIHVEMSIALRGCGLHVTEEFADDR
jgi:hypothetical protein